eukprot:jgi/Psemu1/22724/gm1.22724_g
MNLLLEYAHLYPTFTVNLGNTQANTPPAQIRETVAAAGAQRLPLALGVMQPRINQALGAPPSQIDGNTYAFNGNLYKNSGLTIQLVDTLFNMAPNQIFIPSIGFITTQLATDPALTALGPFTQADTDVTVARFQGIIPISNWWSC